MRKEPPDLGAVSELTNLAGRRTRPVGGLTKAVMARTPAEPLVFAEMPGSTYALTRVATDSASEERPARALDKH
jgi:hypothetical protein